MWFSKIINSINSILMFISLLGLFVLITWTYQPNVINQLDSYIITRYTSHYLSKLNEAKIELGNSPTQGLKRLRTLAESLSATEKLDHLDPVKRNVYEMLTSHYRTTGDSKNEFRWATQWIEFDPQDLNGQLAYALAFHSTSEDFNRGIQPLVDLYSRMPNIESIQWPLFLISINQLSLHDTAADIIDLLLDRNIGTESNLQWELFWDNGLGFHPTNSKSIIPTISSDHTLNFSLHLPKGVQRIRIDPPANKLWTFKNTTLRYTLTHSIINTNLLDNSTQASLGLNQMTRHKQSLRSDGSADPYFFFSTPIQIGENKFLIEFQANVSRTYPDAMHRFFSANNDDSMMEELKSKNHVKLLAKVKELKGTIVE